MSIKVRALRRTFASGGHPPLVVLDGVDFEVEDGGLVTLMGPSGCGKTTILKIIAGIETADSGDIEMNPPAPDRDRIPIIWQEHRLLPWRTVLRNVTFPLELSRVGRAEANKRAKDLLDVVELKEFSSYYPWQLSGGMAQRVAIARALIVEPNLLLMDEPFASIDYQSKRELCSQVQAVRAERLLTIVYVTHDLRDAVQMSDRIILLSDRPTRVREVIDVTDAHRAGAELENYLESVLARKDRASLPGDYRLHGP